MKRLLIVASILVSLDLAMANTTNSTPYTNSFEQYSVGTSVIGSNGWYAADTNAAVVVTNEYVYAGSRPLSGAHTNVLDISDTTTNRVSSQTNVFVSLDVMARPTFLSDTNLPTTSPEDQLAICFSTNGQAMIWHGWLSNSTFVTQWTQLAHTPVVSGEWVRVTATFDYGFLTTSNYFQIQIDNGIALTNQYGQSMPGVNDTGGSWFLCASQAKKYSSEFLADGVSQIDDLLFAQASPPTRNLTVNSVFDVCSPGTGTVAHTYNTVLAASVTNSPFVSGGTTQYVATGWTGTGSVPASGSTTNTGAFTLTNDSTIAWNWTTNYWLDTATNGPGSVNVVDQWLALGSNITVTASPAANYHFTTWSGDTQGATNNPAMSVTMDRARTLTAHFAIDQHDLVVTSPYDPCSPAVGTNVYNWGSGVTAAVTNSPFDLGGTTQYVATGWTGTGSVPASGSTTNTGAFTLTNDSTIAWNWMTNYWLDTATNGPGSVDVVDQWLALGSNITVTASPAANHHFIGWSGDTQGATNNPAMSVTMDRARTLMAHFAIDQHDLVVTSPYDPCSPAVGTNVYNWSSGLTAAVTNSPFVLGGTTQYVATGWTGTGSVPASGSTTNTGAFTLTNDSTIAWNWMTNYWLDTATNGPGSVDVVDQWLALGSNITVTASPATNYHFTRWSGDTQGATNNLAMSVTMDKARTLTAHFEVDQFDLVVSSPFDPVDPPIGTNVYDWNTLVTASVTNPSIIVGVTTQYTCTGWTGSGSVPASGTSNSVSFTITNGSSITWLWLTNHWPVANGDTAATTEDSPVVINVLTNDTDLDGHSLIVAAVALPTYGTAVINAGGTNVTYTPDPNWYGADSFVYWAADGNGGSNSALVVMTVSGVADTIYVAPGGTNDPPYSSWAGAANDILDATSIALDGDTVLVSNGVYILGGPVDVDHNFSVRSLNGPEGTIIDANNAFRGFSVTHSNAVVEGLTIRNGVCGSFGGGVYLENGGSVSNCTVENSFASVAGGGIAALNSGVIRDCLVQSNSAYNGGGILADTDSIVEWCTVLGNQSSNLGGGICASNSVMIRNCLVVSNLSAYGGGIYSRIDTDIDSSEISGNWADLHGGGVVSYGFSRMRNCTVAGNAAGVEGGGIHDFGTTGLNCIVWGNVVTNGSASSNIYFGVSEGFTYTCSRPLITGEGNLDVDPLFLDPATGDYHLATNSPCRNTGTNQAWMGTARDCNDHDRIRYSTVDMGAYEGYLWYQSVNLGGDWNWSDWFGYFNEFHFPWIFHNEHGWMYCNNMEASYLDFYTQDMGWLWSTESLYPYLYRVGDGAWLWYLAGSESPRWFYNFLIGSWETR